MLSIFTPSYTRQIVAVLTVLLLIIWMAIKAFAQPENPRGPEAYQPFESRRQFFMAEEAFMEAVPTMVDAIKQAENNPQNHGVLSVDTDNPTRVIQDSLINNYARWSAGLTPAPWIDERPRKFIDFMHTRWAPVGAENDPEGLNRHWANNVRKILKRNMRHDRYRRLIELNLI